MILRGGVTASVTLIFSITDATAHMILKTPRPYGQATLDNSPLRSDGSDFPCKLRPDAFQYNEETVTEMPLRSEQTLSFVGSAVHGGGSCQLSITYDFPPRSSSTFKVIQSIEGGCPAQVPGNLPPDARGTGAPTFQYTIPTNLPVGRATLAWTWFNRVGNREMYMNCAPILLSGTAATDSARSSFQSLPDLFTANIANGCATLEAVDLAFPNPGSAVMRKGSGPLSKPIGSCTVGRANHSSAYGSFDTSHPVEFSSLLSGNHTHPNKQRPTNFSSASSDSAPTLPAPTSRCGLDQVGRTFCNGDGLIGTCNFGHIVWMKVSAGTRCMNGFLHAVLEDVSSRPNA